MDLGGAFSRADLSAFVSEHYRPERMILAAAGAVDHDQIMKLAEATLEEAKDDFAKAVKKGDRGSTKDIGVVPRGVLEPKLEYAVFTLAKGKVYPEPLDTPRGYWVVIRNE